MKKMTALESNVYGEALLVYSELKGVVAQAFMFADKTLVTKTLGSSKKAGLRAWDTLQDLEHYCNETNTRLVWGRVEYYGE